jgi:hypothetical protein
MVLIGRILGTIVALNLFVLAVFVGLATLQYNAILSNLTRERLVVLADTVRAPFQAVANLGVGIDTVRNADAVLERARQSDDAIAAIHVISPDGDIVRSTSLQPSVRAMDEWRSDLLNVGDGNTWHLETRDRFLVGARITGPGGEEAGGVLIEYSKRSSNILVQAMEARLVLLAGAILLVTTLLGLIILRLVLSEHLRIFGGILASFDEFERKFWRGEGSSEGPEVNVRGLGLDTSEFRGLLETSEDQYQREKRGPAAGPRRSEA